MFFYESHSSSGKSASTAWVIKENLFSSNDSRKQFSSHWGKCDDENFSFIFSRFLVVLAGPAATRQSIHFIVKMFYCKFNCYRKKERTSCYLMTWCRRLVCYNRHIKKTRDLPLLLKQINGRKTLPRDKSYKMKCTFDN